MGPVYDEHRSNKIKYVYIDKQLQKKMGIQDCSGKCSSDVKIEDPLRQSTYADGYNEGFDEGYKYGVESYDKLLTPVRVIYNPPATIVFWANGEKTVVKCSPGEKFNKYHGFCAAMTKRVFGNNNQVNKCVNSGEDDSKVKSSKSKDAEKKPVQKSSKGSKKK
jgi:hypothetical protein